MNSIWYLGLNAFCKLLSTSNAQESISLFKEYKGFLEEVVSKDEFSNLADKLKHSCHVVSLVSIQILVHYSSSM